MICESSIQLPMNGTISCRFFLDECVIYNQFTAETHLLGGIGAEIFNVISKKSITRNQLLQYIRNIFIVDTDFDIETYIDNLILEYQQLGLLVVSMNYSA